MGAGASLACWLLASFVVGLAGTWLARAYALRRELFDHPGERRSHQVATPRGGGISVVVVLLLALGVLAWASPSAGGAMALAGSGLVLVAGIGWIDDHRPLSPWLRLGIHVAAGALLALAIRHLGGGWLDAVLAFVAAVVLTNVWNFMDGIDGLAATQAGLVAAAWAVFAGDGPVLWLGLALVAGVCGFLPFNLPRARIFLGDVGSGALGYALAGLLAVLSLRQGAGTRLILTIPLLPFLLDASLTLLSRMLRREVWWHPHVEHAYQAWARVTGSHPTVTAMFGLATLFCAVLMLGFRSFTWPAVVFMYVMLLMTGAMAWHALRSRGLDGFN